MFLMSGNATLVARLLGGLTPNNESSVRIAARSGTCIDIFRVSKLLRNHATLMSSLLGSLTALCERPISVPSVGDRRVVSMILSHEPANLTCLLGCSATLLECAIRVASLRRNVMMVMGMVGGYDTALVTRLSSSLRALNECAIKIASHGRLVLEVSATNGEVQKGNVRK
jgi:hypothetical protein